MLISLLAAVRCFAGQAPAPGVEVDEASTESKWSLSLLSARKMDCFEKRLPTLEVVGSSGAEGRRDE